MTEVIELIGNTAAIGAVITGMALVLVQCYENIILSEDTEE